MSFCLSLSLPPPICMYIYVFKAWVLFSRRARVRALSLYVCAQGMGIYAGYHTATSSVMTKAKAALPSRENKNSLERSSQISYSFIIA